MKFVLGLCLVFAVASPAIAEEAAPAAKELRRGFDSDQAWALENSVGLALLTMGRHEQAIPVWKKTIALAAATTDAPACQCNSWYNLACAYSVLGRLDEAFEALAKAFEIGGSAQVAQLNSHSQQDADLANMRADERWQALGG